MANSPKAPHCKSFSNAAIPLETSRYYVLSIEQTLFAKHTLIRRWGRIGCLGRERLQFFRNEDAPRALVTLETWLTRKRKRGYAPRSAQACPALLCHDSASS
jgi:predicted DNA-binding WGR domain protein